MRIFIFILLSVCIHDYILAQGGCVTSAGAIYGLPTGDVEGISLAATSGNDGVYVAGIKEDSTLLVKVNLFGIVEWARTFDIVPGQDDNVTSILVDSDGMIAVSGTGGVPGSSGTVVFVFRFNPNNQQILWAKTYFTTPGNYNFGIIQKGAGGNYLEAGDFFDGPNSNNDSELLEINKNTGAVVPGFTKRYDLGSSEGFADMVFYQNFIYGCGRYTDGASQADMRHTLAKLNANDGTQVWVKMGHVPGNLNARLYGTDLVIDQDEIYSTYQGDPTGTSLTNTKIYIQKTDLNGSLLWLKQYELPGINDEVYEMVESGNGMVLLAAAKAAPAKIILFKIDSGGNVLWARQFQFPPIITSIGNFSGKTSQLIEVGGKLVFTGYASNSNGGVNMLLVMTDLDGIVSDPCVSNQLITLAVQTINAPTFYTVNPVMTSHIPIVTTENPDNILTNLMPRQECMISDTIFNLVNATICAGTQYEGYASSGTYVDNFTTGQGCDSVRTLNLVILPPFATNETVSICLGESYEGYSSSGVYTNTYLSIQGCDSIHTLMLTVIPLTLNLNIEICQGEQYEGYEDPGFYTDTIQGVNNSCDTVRYLVLTVHPSDETFMSVSICDGENYEGYSTGGEYTDIFTNIQGCDSIRILDLEVIDDIITQENVSICLGMTYQGHTQSGVYVETFQSAEGCDSTFMLTLEVVALETNVSAQICDGEQYYGHTTTGFYADTLEGFFNECDTIQYLDLVVNQVDQTTINATICSGGQLEGYTSSGQYIDFFLNINGCDSIRTLNLEVTDTLQTEIDVGVCPGTIYEGYSNAGTYSDLFTSVFGCDSIRILNLSVDYPHLNLNIQICRGGQFENYTEAGTYDDILPGIPGACDTMRHLDLIVAPPLETYINATICEDENFLGYNATGLYIDTFSTSMGCDSLRSLNLTVNIKPVSYIDASVCPGEIYEGYSSSGTYVDTLTSVNGCDSMRTINLIVGMPVISMDVSICAGNFFELYDQTGDYTDTLQGVSGECDTLRKIHLTVNPPVQGIISRSICEGENFLGHALTGIYTDTLQTSQGCDSIRTLSLTVSDVITQILDVGICNGMVYEGYADPGIYMDTFVSSFGCDSIRMLNLIIDTPEKHLGVSICNGGMFENYSLPGNYVDTIQGILNACDTIRYLNITMLPAIVTYIDQMICAGEIFLGYNSTGIFPDTFQAADGCDSIRILNLLVVNEILSDFNIEICFGDSYAGHSLAGVYYDTLQAVIGCDSIIALHLEVFTNEQRIDVEICPGEQFENYFLTGSYIDTLPGISSDCDTVRYLELTIQAPMTTQLIKTICAGEEFNGHTSSGFYSDTLSSVSGCDSVVSIELTALDQISTHIQASVCEGETYGYYTAGTYVDTLISYTGCDSIMTIELSGGHTYIPNVFSPNGDGINDVFEVVQFPDNTLQLQYFGIFDRFGDLTYETTSWPVLWNGKRKNGDPFNPAVFAYVMIYKCGNEKITEKGDITLVK
ncbi:MAG: gliding motility-associated C-terminal domain-containing protein [Saprospiraceae bacterium]